MVPAPQMLKIRGVRAQLRDELMPPEEEPQPSAALKPLFEQLSVVIKSAGSDANSCPKTPTPLIARAMNCSLANLQIGNGASLARI